MMTGHINKSQKAAIVIGDNWVYNPEDVRDCDIYYYPENITEWELADEAEHLVEFYAALVWPIWCPPHIRLDNVKKWVLPCERSDRETGLPQCNIFCKDYSKGGCINATNKLD